MMSFLLGAVPIVEKFDVLMAVGYKSSQTAAIRLLGELPVGTGKPEQQPVGDNVLKVMKPFELILNCV